METSLDRFGRVVIPKKVRDELGLRPGTVLQVEEVDRTVRLRPIDTGGELVEDGGVLVFTGAAVGDLAAAVALVRDERADEVGGFPSR